MNKIKIGIIGATGYAAQELTALLVQSSYVKIIFLQSASAAGKKSPHLDQIYENIDLVEMVNRKPDVVFFATPHGIAMKDAPYFLENNIKVIDLSGDFRFYDPLIFEKAYNMSHLTPQLKGVFGLTEIFYKQIKSANLIANPGCYVTACLLALFPLQSQFDRAVLDAKSGYSGAGKNFSDHERLKNNTIIPYKLKSHRHQVEIQQFFKVPIHFSPHIIDRFRGIEVTIHVQIKFEYCNNNFLEIFQNFYKNNDYIQVQSEIPLIEKVENTNKAILGAFEFDEQGRLIIVAVLDNLRKGAASQAMQNLYCLFDIKDKIPDSLIILK